MAPLSTLRGWGSFGKGGKTCYTGWPKPEPVGLGGHISPPPPRSWVSLLAHRAEAEASQDKPFYYTVGGMGPMGSGELVGGAVPEPWECREDAGALAL